MTNSKRNIETTNNTMPTANIRIPAPPKNLDGPEAHEYLMRINEALLQRHYKEMEMLSKEG